MSTQIAPAHDAAENGKRQNGDDDHDFQSTHDGLTKIVISDRKGKKQLFGNCVVIQNAQQFLTMTLPVTPPFKRIPLRGFHIRAARAMLHWNQETLAKRANVTRHTIFRIECEKRGRPHRSTLNSLRVALEAAGIVFEIDGVALMEIGHDGQTVP